MKDYYQILNVKKNATFDEIKKAYRNLAIKWHPDKNKDPDALNKFKEISEAFQILSNKHKKSEYDVGVKKNDSEFKYVFRDPFEMFDEIFSILNSIFMTTDSLFNIGTSNISVHFINFAEDDEFEHCYPPQINKSNLTGQSEPLMLELDKNRWSVYCDNSVKIGILNNDELNSIINSSFNSN
jgi:curved DNA-binding protein CbpA